MRAPFRLPASPTKREIVAKYFRALGEPSRLRILALLREEGELSVGEFALRLGIHQPSASSHLACLRWCGFVFARRDQRVVRYRIADERVTAIVDLADALLEENERRLAACSRTER